MTGMATLLGLWLLLAASLPAAAAQGPAIAKGASPTALQELTTVTAELQENTKDLRRNITHWQRIARDPQLPAAEKKQWHHKAQEYLQECLAYNTLLTQVDVKKIPDRTQADNFLAARRTFQQELQYFQEILQQSISDLQQTGR